MDQTEIVVHPARADGGRSVSVHVHGEDRPLGIAYRLGDVIEFLRRAGFDLDDVETSSAIEWCGGGPTEWHEPPAAV